MQKVFLSLLLSGITTLALAQNNTLTKSHLIIKLGLPSSILEEGYKLSSPHISARYDHSLGKQARVGGDVGFVSSNSIRYRFLGDTYFYRKNYITVAVNSSYHLDFIPVEKFEFYAGLGAGYKLGWSKFVGRGELAGFDSSPDPASNGFIYSAFFEARYPLNSQLSAYAEVGIGYLPVSLGIVYFLSL